MLKTLELPTDTTFLSDEIEQFIEDLDRRVDEFIDGKPFAQDGFVACNHREIAKALLEVQQKELSTGNLFCEWGSGFGGVASIASLIGFESYGIEINPEVFRHSVSLAEDYDVDVDFVEGSFIPLGSDDLVDKAFMDNEGDLTLECHFDDAYAEIGLEVADFDLIFVFPWPNEAPLLSSIFDRFASTGAMLMTFNDFSGLRVERKC